MMKMLEATFKGLFSILALVIGGCLLEWILLEEAVQKGRPWPEELRVLFLAFSMILAGLHWGRQALAYFLRRDV
jgi:hypothetical protein